MPVGRVLQKTVVCASCGLRDVHIFNPITMCMGASSVNMTIRQCHPYARGRRIRAVFRAGPAAEPAADGAAARHPIGRNLLSDGVAGDAAFASLRYRPLCPVPDRVRMRGCLQFWSVRLGSDSRMTHRSGGPAVAASAARRRGRLRRGAASCGWRLMLSGGAPDS